MAADRTIGSASAKRSCSFGTSCGVLSSRCDSSATSVSAATLRDLARTLRAGVVEVAGVWATGDDLEWKYSRLDGEGVRTQMAPGDSADLAVLLDRIVGRGVVSPDGVDAETADRLDRLFPVT